MKKLILYPTLLLFLLTACDPNTLFPDMGTTSVIAIREAMTHEASDTPLKSSDIWWEHDELTVALNVDNALPVLAHYTLSDGSGKNTALFDNITTDYTQLGEYALFPHHAATLDGTRAVYTYPDTYTYQFVPETVNGITSLSAIDPTLTIAMAGRIVNQETMMKHLGGLLVLDFERIPCASGRLALTLSHPVTGAFSIPLEDIGTDQGTLSIIPSDEARNTLSISFAQAHPNRHGLFLIPLPVGSYSGLTISVFTNQNGTNEEIQQIEIKRDFQIVRKSVIQFDIIGLSN